MKNKLLSFVIPCYRSENTIRLVVKEIGDIVALRPEFDYEIIAVEDNSPDRVWHVLKEIAGDNKRVKIVSLAKNVGKHSAVIAGYKFASGQYVIDLDDDFQSPVRELWRLIEPIEKGLCDYTTAKYYSKKQTLIKRFGSDFNLRMSTYLLNKPKGLRFENFSAMRHFVCKEVAKYSNPYPYLEGLVLRATSRIGVVEMEQRERADEKDTGFTLGKSASLLFNGLTGFSVKPLRLASLLGIFFAVVGICMASWIIVQKVLNPNMLAGFPSIMAGIFFIGGSTMLLLGVIGEYVGRIYICINSPPQHVIRETMNIEKTESKNDESH